MTRARILVVEDESIVAEDIRDILKNLGYSVTAVASSSEEAIRKAVETRPDLVLMDIMLEGDTDGVEAAEQIYARLNIPVVYLTAYADDATLQRAKMTGPFGYILKPFEERELHSTIEVALHKHGTETELRERERWLTTTLRSIGDAVVTTDTKGRVVLMNPVAQTMTGWKLEEARGKPLKNVLTIARAETGESFASLVTRIIREGALIGLADDSVVLTKDGTKWAIDGTGAPIRDDKGEITGAVLVFRTVTDRERDRQHGVAGIETRGDRSAAEVARDESRGRYCFADIVSKNQGIRKIFDVLPDIAMSDSTVLLEGPSGSGKELFARAIHNLSRRRRRRYVVVTCGALPDTLLESELFGYVKGAFTDAKGDKPGRFAVAEGGTIFLDDVGDVSPALQAKLLRILEQKEYEPLGSTATVKANVRIIAATNRTLSELVARGSFREDLYYRLNVVKIVLPSLSSRREDIPLLVAHSIRKFNAKTGKNIERVSNSVSDLLMRYDFPGNVRELENVIEHAFVLCRGREIALEHLPKELLESASRSDNEGTEHTESPLGQAEAAAILEALRMHKGNRRKTASYLGIGKTTLWRKIKKYGVTYEPPEENGE